MKITDGKKTVEIKMIVWDETRYTPDWSADFFQAGSLPYNEYTDTYTVKDVDYCIDQALDWRDSKGDFSDAEPNENNTVFCDEV